MATNQETTNIDDLPSSNSNNVNSAPVQNVFSENNTENVKMPNYGEQLNSEKEVAPALQNIDYTSKLNSTLKDIGDGNPLQLPSRDIPQNTASINNDVNVQPNYIPPNNNDYIANYVTPNEIIEQNREKEHNNDKTEEFYETIQMPLLVGLLFFIFQLPFIRKNLFIYLPSLFNKDGNPNLSGYVFNSAIFALLYFSFTYILKYISI
tara:strand:+ start:18581 stop:19201 length:621 start_codon:yes stop_codon:yes gene_type:complete